MSDRILIEEYRGFDIYFCKSSEVFTCISGEYDVQKNKNTLTLAKKEIDAYIKENLNFTPIWVERCSSGWRGEKQAIQLIAIRKDGRFVFENKKGEKEQLSEWDEKEYWIKSPYNKPIFERINEIDNDIAMLQAERMLEESNLVKEDKGLKELKSKFIK